MFVLPLKRNTITVFGRFPVFTNTGLAFYYKTHVNFIFKKCYSDQNLTSLAIQARSEIAFNSS